MAPEILLLPAMIMASLLLPALQALSLVASDPGPQWLAPAIPQLEAVQRPDMGLPGVGAPERPDFDLGTQASAITQLGVTVRDERVHDAGASLDRGLSAFWTKTMVALPGGGTLGFDASDLQEKLAFRDAQGRRLENWDSPAGIRVGGAWDLLYPVFADHWASWGIEGWLPAWSDGETSLRTGLRLGSAVRIDGGVAWRELEEDGRRDTGDGLWDSLVSGGHVCNWDARLGGNVGRSQWQAWWGFRTIDPRGERTAWQQFGRAVDLGASLRFSLWGSATLLEWRGEAGREWAALHAEDIASHLEHRLWSGRFQIEPWTPFAFGFPSLSLEWASLHLEETALTSPADDRLPGLRGASAAGSSDLVRRGGRVSWTVLWKNFSFTPELGWSRIERTGALPLLWTGGIGNAATTLGAVSQAELWTLGGGVVWSFAGSRWNYRVTKPWSDASGVAFGMRHDLLLSQTF